MNAAKNKGWVLVLGLGTWVACADDSRPADDDDGGTGGGQGTTSQASSGSQATSSSSASSSGAGGSSAACANGPLSAPIPGCAPSPLPSTGDFHQDCVDRINRFRWECQCLPPLARWVEAESCTNQQSAGDQGSGQPHGNFGMCGENAQNTCPDWPSQDAVVSGCLQMMWDEGPGRPFEEHGHYLNMASTSFGKVACGFSAGGGGVWSNQNFAP